ncbi:hypothetical protein CCMA1212_001265 [Trichoderma ghanense]|uniref:Uncharacterized protein n=1 Tax=Trichoderma ghanense TaxID=65468 RepID=A0ABY2HI04_9HYPO
MPVEKKIPIGLAQGFSRPEREGTWKAVQELAGSLAHKPRAMTRIPGTQTPRGFYRRNGTV